MVMIPESVFAKVLENPKVSEVFGKAILDEALPIIKSEMPEMLSKAFGGTAKAAAEKVGFLGRVGHFFAGEFPKLSTKNGGFFHGIMEPLGKYVGGRVLKIGAAVGIGGFTAGAIHAATTDNHHEAAPTPAPAEEPTGPAQNPIGVSLVQQAIAGGAIPSGITVSDADYVSGGIFNTGTDTKEAGIGGVGQ